MYRSRLPTGNRVVVDWWCGGSWVFFLPLQPITRSSTLYFADAFPSVYRVRRHVLIVGVMDVLPPMCVQTPLHRPAGKREAGRCCKRGEHFLWRHGRT
jgi:hypothetical protein